MAFTQQVLKRWRIILKHTLNPLTRRLARSSFGPFSLVRHVGRRSGKQYETPLVAVRTDDGFVIELTYGPDVDWYKNVLAAGGCTIVWHGKDYVIDGIEPLNTETGRATFPRAAQLIFHLLNLRHFVKLKGQRSGTNPPL